MIKHEIHHEKIDHSDIQQVYGHPNSLLSNRFPYKISIGDCNKRQTHEKENDDGIDLMDQRREVKATTLLVVETLETRHS